MLCRGVVVDQFLVIRENQGMDIAGRERLAACGAVRWVLYMNPTARRTFFSLRNLGSRMMALQ
jgi:hypothetical protein